MKWLNFEKIRMLYILFVTAIVICSGNAKADFTFGEPTNLGPTINGSSGEATDSFSSDGLEMYFDSKRPGGQGGWDIWVSTRATIEDDWGTPENLGPPVNSGNSEVCASISSNGLELYFDDTSDILVTTRETVNDSWGQPVKLGPTINTSAWEGASFISSDGLELYFCRRGGGYGSWDMWVTRRAAANEPWENPVNLGEVINSPSSECYPFISADGLLLLFSDFGFGQPSIPGGFGNADMWAARRASVSDPWDTPFNLGPIVNSPSFDGGPKLSPDGFTLYFSSERPGGYGGSYGDIYQAPIIPIVDLNGDGNIDTDDLLIMINNWGSSESLCDIGPMPWGDGVVDIEDLKVFIKYWEQENMPQESQDVE